MTLIVGKTHILGIGCYLNILNNPCLNAVKVAINFSYVTLEWHYLWS